jgi:hypothetical protein
MFDYQLLILSWLGGMQQPVGLSAMVIGGALFAMGKLQEFRNASPVPSPTDPILTSPDAAPVTSAPESPASAEGPIG